MKKSNVLKELEMTQAWLDIYMEKLEDIPGDTIREKIDFLLEFYNSPPQMKPPTRGTLYRSILPPPFRDGEKLAPHLIKLTVGI